MFTYWFTSNCFSLGQVALLRLPLIRNKFGIPERIKHPPSALPQNGGLIESMKKGEHSLVHSILMTESLSCCRYDLFTFAGPGWKNAQLAQQLEERERRIKNHLNLAAKGQSQLHRSFVFALTLWHWCSAYIKCSSMYFVCQFIQHNPLKPLQKEKALPLVATDGPILANHWCHHFLDKLVNLGGNFRCALLLIKNRLVHLD